MHPQVLNDFAINIESALGPGCASLGEAGIVIHIDDIQIHVDLDRLANRAVIWSTIARPPHTSLADAEHMALEYGIHRALRSGCIIGVDARSDFIVLGRSAEDDVLTSAQVIDLVGCVAHEIAVVTETLASVS